MAGIQTLFLIVFASGLRSVENIGHHAIRVGCLMRFPIVEHMTSHIPTLTANPEAPLQRIAGECEKEIVKDGVHRSDGGMTHLLHRRARVGWFTGKTCATDCARLDDLPSVLTNISCPCALSIV